MPDNRNTYIMIQVLDVHSISGSRTNYRPILEHLYHQLIISIEEIVADKGCWYEAKLLQTVCQMWKKVKLEVVS